MKKSVNYADVFKHFVRPWVKTDLVLWTQKNSGKSSVYILVTLNGMTFFFVCDAFFHKQNSQVVLFAFLAKKIEDCDQIIKFGQQQKNVLSHWLILKNTNPYSKMLNYFFGEQFV